MLRAALCALVLAASPLAVQAQAPTPPPAAAFARLPAVQQAEISPNGRMIAILGGAAADRSITLNPIDGASSVKIPLGAVDVEAIRWTGDDYVVATVRIFDSKTNFSDGRTYSYNLQRDIVFNMKGDIVGLLLDGISWAGLATTRPIRGVIEGPRPAVIMLGIDYQEATQNSHTRLNPKGSDFVSALYKVDVATGTGRLYERGNPFTVDYAVDLSGEPRVRFDIEKGFTSLFTRRKGGASWTLVDKSPSISSTVAFLGYSDAEDAVYLKRGSGTGERVVRRLLADGSETDVGPATPAVDVDLQWDERTRRPVAIVTGGGERPLYQWLDPRLGALHAKLSRSFKGRDVRFESWSADMSRIVLRVDAVGAAPIWFLFEPATSQASPLGEEYPELAGVAFGKTSWLSFKAADGLAMNAYLTVPANLAPGRKAPLIVMPHGGPASRDEFSFDWWEQFLVSRGYAVLKPQFRGSAGFGYEFQAAGFNEWGGKMQSDLPDAIDAIDDPAVDKTRVCIAGASYGGFAALHGATMRPERYRCAISANGVSDLATMLGHARVSSGSESPTLRYWRDVIGDSRVEGRRIDEASPARRAGARTAPVLLIYALQDTTVPARQSLLMKEALERVGVPHQAVVLEGDDHYFSSTRSRLQTLEATEAFLTKYLPVTP